MLLWHGEEAGLLCGVLCLNEARNCAVEQSLQPTGLTAGGIRGGPQGDMSEAHGSDAPYGGEEELQSNPPVGDEEVREKT